MSPHESSSEAPLHLFICKSRQKGTTIAFNYDADKRSRRRRSRKGLALTLWETLLVLKIFQLAHVDAEVACALLNACFLSFVASCVHFCLDCDSFLIEDPQQGSRGREAQTAAGEAKGRDQVPTVLWENN